MLFVGLALPVLIGWWLLGRTPADRALTLIGLVSLPLLVWGASLGAKIGPCEVPACMTSTQHSHLVISIVALVIALVAFVALSMGRRVVGGLILALAQLVGTYSMLKTDVAAAITFLLLGVAAVAYLYVHYRLEHEADYVPDYPPAS